MNMMWQQQFYNQLADPAQLTALFDCMSDVYFYAKNLNSQFTMCNEAQLSLIGLTDKSEFITKTDHDFYEHDKADLYIQEDKLVFNGESIVNKRWMVTDKDGQMNWYLSSKLPLKNNQGKIIGLCGLLRDIKKTGLELKPYYDLAEVIDYIDIHFCEQIKMKTLADILSLSVSQLDRKFKEFTGVSPMTYIVKVRLASVAHDLRCSDLTISELAQKNGFYDHSQLSRFFKKYYTVSPNAYRKII